MSESQAVNLAMEALPPSPQNSEFRADFKDGIWEISLIQPGVWGISSIKTNKTNGKVEITSTNSTQVVARIRDADGKVEVVKRP